MTMLQEKWRNQASAPFIRLHQPWTVSRHVRQCCRCCFCYAKERPSNVFRESIPVSSMRRLTGNAADQTQTLIEPVVSVNESAK